MKAKRCEHVEPQLTDYLLGELPADRSAAVRRHLETCSGCRALAQALASTLDLVRGALAADLAEAPRLEPARRARIRGIRPRGRPANITRFGLAFVRAAALVVVGLGLAAAILMPSMRMARVPRATAEGRSLIHSLMGKETESIYAVQGSGQAPPPSNQPARDLGGRGRFEADQPAAAEPAPPRSTTGYKHDRPGAAGDEGTGQEFSREGVPPRLATRLGVGAAWDDRGTVPDVHDANGARPTGDRTGSRPGKERLRGRPAEGEENALVMKGLFAGRSGGRRTEALPGSGAAPPVTGPPPDALGPGVTRRAQDARGDERFTVAGQTERASAGAASQDFYFRDPASTRVRLGDREPGMGVETALRINADRLFQNEDVSDSLKDTKPAGTVSDTGARHGERREYDPLAEEPRRSPENGGVGVPPPEKKEQAQAGAAGLLDADGDERRLGGGTSRVDGRLKRGFDLVVPVDDKGGVPEAGVPSATKPEPAEEAPSGPVFRPAGFNPYVETAKQPFSTFSIDVDTASYAIARRYITEGRRPPPEAVRTEEFVNFFDYDYPPPSGQTFGIYTDWAASPFRPSLDLLKIGIKGLRIGRDQHRSVALTLVVDTSGSMNTPDRLGRVKQALGLLVGRLDPRDSVALVQFDSRARMVLDHTPAAERPRILAAIDGLKTSGSTHLEGGLTLGYTVASRGFRAGASNRVLLMSDGVANLGAAEAPRILSAVAAFREQGIYCSVFGFGTGAYNDAMLEALADKGDGSYVFIDSLEEARRVLVDELAATLHVIARDVKIQVEFNPKRVRRYRQVGYENRALTKEQFRDDRVDAGEVGSGQSVTALYEIDASGPAREPLGVVRVRYREADTGAIREVERRLTGALRCGTVKPAPLPFRLAAGVAEFAELLRMSPYTAGTDFDDVAAVLRTAALERPLDRHVQELVRLAQAAGRLPKP